MAAPPIRTRILAVAPALLRGSFLQVAEDNMPPLALQVDFLDVALLSVPKRRPGE